MGEKGQNSALFSGLGLALDLVWKTNLHSKVRYWDPEWESQGVVSIKSSTCRQGYSRILDFFCFYSLYYIFGVFCFLLSTSMFISSHTQILEINISHTYLWVVINKLRILFITVSKPSAPRLCYLIKLSLSIYCCCWIVMSCCYKHWDLTQCV